MIGEVQIYIGSTNQINNLSGSCYLADKISTQTLSMGTIY